METETRGPGLWKMNTSILENPEYVKRFELFWKGWTKQKCNFSTLTSWWEIAKIRIKEISIDFCKELNKSKTGIKQLEKTMEQLKQKQLTDDICSEIQLLSEKIKDHYKNQAKAAQIRSRAKFITENEKSTAYFFNLEKIRGKVKLWSKIKTESGETKYGIQNILHEQKRFYKKLFKSEGIDMQAATELLTDVNTSLECNDSNNLENNLNIKELEHSVFNFKKSAEWYQKFCYKSDWLDVWPLVLSVAVVTISPPAPLGSAGRQSAASTRLTESDSRLSGMRPVPSPVLCFRLRFPALPVSPWNLGGWEGGGVDAFGSDGDKISCMNSPRIGS
ncbi:YTX2-like protein [Mya arenaria]|uniref:YTX2-like protein n=1 Tax=Mya arenaria TaxID=6604 RepID=A0ABY7GHL4_MYAAR|nr:YTX2-like protein [Mya arenaria]